MINLIKGYLKSDIKLIVLIVIAIGISIGGFLAVIVAEYSQLIENRNFIMDNKRLYGSYGTNIKDYEIEKIKNYDRVENIYYTNEYGMAVDGKGLKTWM